MLIKNIKIYFILFDRFIFDYYNIYNILYKEKVIYARKYQISNRIQ